MSLSNVTGANISRSAFTNVHRDQNNVSIHPDSRIMGDIIIGGEHNTIFNRPPAETGLYQLLSPVDGAGYNRGGPVSRCKPGTREPVISQIHIWANQKGLPICWLNGPAGFGKSAIAQTVAEHYAADGRLGGSFFFLRGAGRRSTFSGLIPTLVHQLSVSHPSTKPLIETVLLTEPKILQDNSLSYQLQKLIAEPVLAMRNSLTPTIFVMDALDECGDKELVATFIDALVDICAKYPSLRILLTSRIEEHIRRKFDNPRAEHVIKRLELEAFDARPDIQKFFETEFSEIYAENRPVLSRIVQPWPSQQEMDILLSKSGRSFIFAITLMQMIRSSDSPNLQLQIVLRDETIGLDHLYQAVFASVIDTQLLRRIIGAIMILTEPQSVTVLSDLLNYSSAEIVQSLLGVQSIIRIPGDDDDFVQLYHTSLRDFLTSQHRSHIYYINPPLQHIQLAIGCLQCLTQRPADIVFERRAERYAVLQWPNHVLQGLKGDSIFEASAYDSLISSLYTVLSQSSERWFNTILNSDISMIKTIKENLAEVGEYIKPTHKMLMEYINYALKFIPEVL